MRADLRRIAETLALGAAVASIGYTAFAIARLRAFSARVRERSAPARPPSVTILKPVAGVEPGLEENLRSFCAQDYPDYAVVLGVRDPDDPALDTLRRIATAFPDRATVVVGDGSAAFRNPKIATLAPMLAHARGEILVIADSDMHVGPDYLEAIAAPFADARVGAVTALYRGEPAGNDMASALGAMWITEQFAPSVLVANALEPLTYCFGATMAVRRDVFDALGGLDALGDRLADDHELGRLVTDRGYRVALAAYVVANTVAERDLRALVAHELRWARTIRTVRLGGYAGIALTYPIPLAVAFVLLARNRNKALPILALAATARLALHAAAQSALATQRAPSRSLIPGRDLLGIAIWALGLRGRRVRWREDALSTDRTGGLDAPDAGSASSPR